MRLTKKDVEIAYMLNKWLGNQRVSLDEMLASDELRPKARVHIGHRFTKKGTFDRAVELLKEHHVVVSPPYYPSATPPDLSAWYPGHRQPVIEVNGRKIRTRDKRRKGVRMMHRVALRKRQ